MDTVIGFFTSMFPIPATPDPTWYALEWGAYIVSALLILWMVFDMVSTNAKFSEETLTSSREGEIEDKLS